MRFVRNGLDESAITADIVDRPRIPEMSDLIISYQVRKQLDVVSVRMAED